MAASHHLGPRRPDGGGGGDPDGGGGEPVDPPATPSGGGGDVGNVVGQVDDVVTGTTGIDLDLGGKTSGVTGAVDGAVGGLTGGQGLGLGNVQLPKLPNVVDLSP